MTESGKSTLAKLLSQQLQRSGKHVAVLEPLMDSGWYARFRTDDIDVFCDYLRKNQSVYAFVDEGGEYFDDGNNGNYSWLATRSRHYGHSVFFLAQRAMQIPKTMRDQCNRLFLFTSSWSDGKLHAEEWNKPGLQTCNTLPRLSFFMADRYGILKRMKISANYREVIADDTGANYADNRSVRRSRNNPSSGYPRGEVDQYPGAERSGNTGEIRPGRASV